MAEEAGGMKVVRVFKMPFTTNHFNANQKVWIVFLSGDEAAEVCGRYRGRGRYVRAWVKWSSKDKTRPVIKEIEVTDAFYSRLFSRC